MPDTWTSNPEQLRNTLSEAGMTCGVPSRVLKPRETEWTCTFDSKGWLRDVYIHHVDDLVQHPYYLSQVIILFVLGILIGLLWGKRFWSSVKCKPSELS